MKMVFVAEMDTDDFIAAMEESDDHVGASLVQRGLKIKLTKLSLGLLYDIIAHKTIKEAISIVNEEAIPNAIKMALKDGVSD